MQNPLLSICIPTYNRAEHLKITIDSIVQQLLFVETNEVEIVISDNCSDDNTREVVDAFKISHGDKIQYFRNDVNVLDQNMELSLRRGNGLFLKLNNDTLKHHNNSLDVIVNTIKLNLDTKKCLFFLNQRFSQNSFTCRGLDGFVGAVSFHSTWIGSFGIWKEDLVVLTDYSRYAKLQLTQVDVLFRTIGADREVFINTDTLFEAMELPKKGGYDILTVFLDNYTKIIEEAVQNKYLSNTVYIRETEKLLLNFICPWLAKIKVRPDKFYFTAVNGFQRVRKFYHGNSMLLNKFFLKYQVCLLYYSIRKFV